MGALASRSAITVRDEMTCGIEPARDDDAGLASVVSEWKAVTQSERDFELSWRRGTRGIVGRL